MDYAIQKATAINSSRFLYDIFPPRPLLGIGGEIL